MRIQNKLISILLFLCDHLILFSSQYDQHQRQQQRLSGLAPLFVKAFAIVPNNHFRQCSSSHFIQDVGQQSKSSSIISSSSYNKRQYHQCDSSIKTLLYIQRTRNNNILFVSSKNQQESTSNISDMKLKDMREELESYGISTRSFLEKKEFVEALEKARSEGKVPTSKASSTSTKETEVSSSSSSNNDQGSSSSVGETKSSTVTDNYQEMIKNANSMKVSELRKELQEMGISSNTFFEKSEFVKAYVDAIQNGKKKTTTTSSTSSNPSNNKQQQGSSQKESFDPEYRDVIMQKMDKRDPRLLSGSVIDIRVS